MLWTEYFLVVLILCLSCWTDKQVLPVANAQVGCSNVIVNYYRFINGTTTSSSPINIFPTCSSSYFYSGDMTFFIAGDYGKTSGFSVYVESSLHTSCVAASCSGSNCNPSCTSGAAQCGTAYSMTTQGNNQNITVYYIRDPSARSCDSSMRIRFSQTCCPNPTLAPTTIPTVLPTFIPTVLPTFSPTYIPTVSPTASPTAHPTFTPTTIPTKMPTYSPTFIPTVEPSTVPTYSPTCTPTVVPSAAPTY